MAERKSGDGQQAKSGTAAGRVQAPSISLPKGGGAIRGIGEKFAANPVTGTGSLTVPIATTPGRSGFGPQLSLSYNSGSGNGPFGFGWGLSLPSITRKTDKGLPQYRDADESDIFILSGSEDLVPVLVENNGQWERESLPLRTVGGNAYMIQRYRPRIEGLFARIERWTNAGTKETHWRSISRDNITTIYGRTTNSRIEDPEAPAAFPRVFSWLICEIYDDRGNAIFYEYVEEDSRQIELSSAHEKNRTDKIRSSNRYLKRIQYGNKTPVAFDSALPREFREDLSKRTDWLFEVVFDYDEGHYKELPPALDSHQYVEAGKDSADTWPERRDPFSSYRPGFEVRTYRLCHRVMMFHHFPDELGVDDYLVKSTGFKYEVSPIASFITSVTQSGFKRQDNGTYLMKSLPPLEFKYSKAVIQDRVEEVAGESIENLPQGLDGSQYRWADLDGEGLSGILTEQDGAWFYKRNISSLPAEESGGALSAAVRFAPQERLTVLPYASHPGSGRQLLDLAGDGRLDVVDFSGPTPGFFERTHEGAWNSFTAFTSLPNISWQDPNLRFVDLTGDGHADILITEDEAFTWFESLAEAGFAAEESVRQALDEEQGPRLVFADGTQSVYLADCSGDSLTDLVRIRNGEVCYWPNLGYGRFGARVSMDNAPLFDHPDQFDHQRIRLADIDGSGVTDIIYLGKDGIDIYLNESGNRWADARKLKTFPEIDNLSSIVAVDLLGNGTACLVWSSPLPGHAHRPMRYIDLMGGQKPHLLVRTVNNLGAETHIHYAPSTTFYLADKAAGKPWITKIPFPVQVVERVETYDRISRNRFATCYAYHHGYFDGHEREFRGFGMVEQRDTEEFASLSSGDEFPHAVNIEEASHVPAVLTKTWFHTGAYLQGGRISLQLQEEYYREGDASEGEAGLTEAQHQAMLLDDTVLPESIRLSDGTREPYRLSGNESEEACRALKGAVLRQEVYAADGTEEEDRPYTVTECNYSIEVLQSSGPNRHAVFFVHDRETIDFHYERKLYEISGEKRADPRVSHAMTLDVDMYGNVLKSASIGYGRRFDDQDDLFTAHDRDRQKRTLLTYTENRFTNPVSKDDIYRIPMHCETRTYELINMTPDSSESFVTNLFRFKWMKEKITEAADHDLPYSDIDAKGVAAQHPYRRIIEHVRQLYYADDLSGPVPLGEMQSLGLPYESYKLAFTPQLLDDVYRRKGTNLLPDPVAVLRDEGGYVLSDDYKTDGRFPNADPDGCWWMPSGQQFYSPVPTNPAPPKPPALLAQDAVYARTHFFLMQGVRDPFGAITRLTYDSHDLLLKKTEDPLENVTVAETVDNEGNIISGLDYRVLQPWAVIDPNGNSLEAAFDTLGMVIATAVKGKNGEGDSLTDLIADLTQQEMNDFIADPKGQISKDLLKDATKRVIYDVTRFFRLVNADKPVYSASIARETHKSGLPVDGSYKTQVGFSYSDGFGREVQRKIQAEKGPIEEGGIDVDPRWVGSGWTVFNNKDKPIKQYEPFFSESHGFQFGKEEGVSSTLFYDPLGRIICTLHPDHSYEKKVFDPWKQEMWDVNDTVLLDPLTDAGVRGYMEKYLAVLNARPGGWKTWQAARIDGDKGPQEQSAAVKTSLHAGTPDVVFFDALGRTFMSIADNGLDENRIRRRFISRIEYDIEGKPLSVIDHFDRSVMEYRVHIIRSSGSTDSVTAYDMAGNRLYQKSMDAGERWTLNEVTGKPLRMWDSRNHTFIHKYDELRRPTETWIRGGDGSTPLDNLYERIVYGERKSLNGETDMELNLRGKPFEHYDTAGKICFEKYDFKGNLLKSHRRLTSDYKNPVQWNVADPEPRLENDEFRTETEFDALDRVIWNKTPDESITRPAYNEANLLETVDVEQGVVNNQFVKNINYNAKGQRTEIIYEKDTRTIYEYDSDTFRLVHVKTTKSNGGLLQDLYYTYDPAGNVTQIEDRARPTIFFGNMETVPVNKYTYDPLYQLIKAEGREHIAQVDFGLEDNWNDMPFLKQYSVNDPMAWRNYTQQYTYDAVGNIEQMKHIAGGGSWTRDYQYETDSNRLKSTRVGQNLNSFDYIYPHHPEHGFIETMPHLEVMEWNFRDELQAVARQKRDDGGTPETTYYVYDVSGQRIRKVTESAAYPGNTPVRKKERIYLGGVEFYKEYTGPNAGLERETLHVADDTNRIVMIESRNNVDDGSPRRLIRYQLSNHLRSAHLEMDDNERIISYEEYHPYGTTSHQAVDKDIKAVAKLYRYTGKERDEESGLYYHGARYLAPWLGRWCSADPVPWEEQNDQTKEANESNESADGETINEPTDEPIDNTREDQTIFFEKDGINLYIYVSNNPLVLFDPDGRAPQVVGRVYVIEGTVGGKSSVYVGSTAQELRQRFSSHQWKKLIQAKSTKITVYEVTADIKPGMTRSKTARAAVNQALRAVEQKALSKVRKSGAVRVLNRVRAAVPKNISKWIKNHSPKLSRPRTAKPPGGGLKLRAAGGSLILLDAFMMAREMKVSQYTVGPAVLVDEWGEFKVDYRLGPLNGLWGNEYYENYISGPLAGKKFKISEEKFEEYRKEARALYGYLDWAGDFVPGLIQPHPTVVHGGTGDVI